jgi:threonyl-tRNA synthetase
MSQSVETEPGGPPAAEADDLYKLRHSLAHVLAMAVQDLRPGTKLGFGPPIDDGFYYDFVLSEPLSDKDFPEIERRMRQILKRNVKFEEEQLPVPEALERLEQMGEPYKVEYAKELAETQDLDTLGFYRSGDFVDMCRGPHVAHTGKIPSGSFKLRNVAGAYWRGDSDNVQMTRVYAWAYPTKEELDQHVREYELALERDHKKLGRDLDLFEIDTEYVGPGLPLWLPKGTVIRDELEKLAKELEFEAGYERVATPVIAKTDLYFKSGHLPYYQEHMYPFMDLHEKDEHGNETIREQYVLRPMNCPHHHRVYSARPRSYRDLPLRLAEYGNVYRYEDRGALSGLLRVRAMTMNDAHIYCTEEQIKAEFIAVIEMHQRIYEILGLHDYYMRLSTWDPDSEKGKEKYVDDPPAWEKTQDLIREAMDETGVPYVEGKGEAAFYGPKIDVQFRTVTGREESASTNQLDFAQPERMGLTYQGADNQEHRPYVIHRAPLGTHERFTAFLIEHYGGAFPTWLAPVQVRVLTVSDRFDDYARNLVKELRRESVRAELDERHDTLGKGIRMAAAEKVPNTLVIGEREVEDQTVTLRRFGSREQETMPVEEFRARLRKAIAERSQDL